jgi:hypothetical protein
MVEFESLWSMKVITEDAPGGRVFTMIKIPYGAKFLVDVALLDARVSELQHSNHHHL